MMHRQFSPSAVPGVLADEVWMPERADLFKEIPVCIDFLPCYGIDNTF